MDPGPAADLAPRRALAVASRRLEAAATLLDCRFHADGCALLRSALEELVSVGTSLPDGPAASDALRAELDALTAAPPEDAEVGAELLAASERALEQGRVYAVALGEALLDSRTRTFRARLRAAVAVALALLALVVVGAVIRRVTRLRIVASATGTFGDDPNFDVSRVVDGRTDTEWLGRDAQRETVTLSLSRASRLRGIRVLNGRNPPFFDRSVAELEVELFAGGRRVFQKRSALERPGRAAPWWSTRFDVDGVTSVKLTAHRPHGLGVGLAEVELETD